METIKKDIYLNIQKYFKILTEQKEVSYNEIAREAKRMSISLNLLRTKIDWELCLMDLDKDKYDINRLKDIFNI